jgi:hypothetical protein
MQVEKLILADFTKDMPGDWLGYIQYDKETGTAYATNGHIFVCCDCPKEQAFEARETPPKSAAAQAVRYIKEIKALTQSVDLDVKYFLEQFPENAPCLECEGSGQAIYKYHSKNSKTYNFWANCPVCEGEGVEEKKKAWISAKGADFGVFWDSELLVKTFSIMPPVVTVTVKGGILYINSLPISALVMGAQFSPKMEGKKQIGDVPVYDLGTFCRL